MDADCFDAISRSLSAAVSSRRRLLTGVAGGTLGTLLGLHGLKEVAAARQQTASCEAPNGFIAGDGEARYAQSFIPALGGKLSRVRVTIRKNEGTTGAYVLQIVNIVGGKPDPDPTNALATARIGNRKVRVGLKRTLTFNFGKDKAAIVQAGTEYAFIITRDGSSDLTVFGDSGNPCSGQGFFFDTSTGQFAVSSLDFDFTAFVGYP
jgi:hypothetical protein